MTKVVIVGFVDSNDKPRGSETIVRFHVQDQIVADSTQLSDPEFVDAVRAKARQLGLYPSKNPGVADGGRFDLVYRAADGEPLPGHGIGGAPIDNRRTTS